MARTRKVVNLVGTRVGRLLVTSQAPDRVRVRKDSYNSVRAYWNCLCDCGKSVEVRQDAILSEKSNSCGCIRDEVAKTNIKAAQANYKPKPMEDLTGRTFGRLSVVSLGKTATTPKGRLLKYWTCECLCGNTKDIESGQLRQGKAVSCGCVTLENLDSDFMSKTDLFVSRAVKVHGDKYDYSLVDFKHSQQNINIVCTVHGVFSQKPWNHINGTSCPACSKTERVGKTTYTFKEELMCSKHQKLYPASTGCVDCKAVVAERNMVEFLEKARDVHADKYDYSKVEFTLMKDRITIICPHHGEFEQQVALHLQGNNCAACAYKLLTKTTEEFVDQAKEKHGEFYDYSEVEYVYCYDKVKIKCPNHGDFYQKPSSHLNGQGCTRCAGESRALKQHWNYIKRCELNPELAQSEGTLYLLEMFHENETFLKIGISSDFNKRIGRYREERISFNILSEVKSTAIQTAMWERDILKDIREQGFKYIPEVSFKGWTECAAIENKDYILELFNNIQ